MPVDPNPFAILTFIAAPAVLTNASSLLAMGTSNRFGRNVDRARQLIKMLQGVPTGGEPTDEVKMQRKLLEWIERRLQMLMRAMSMFYSAIGCFAGASLASLLGAILNSTGMIPNALTLNVILSVALLIGFAGLGALIAGGTLLVHETRLALRTISEEMRFYRGRYGNQ